MLTQGRVRAHLGVLVRAIYDDRLSLWSTQRHVRERTSMSPLEYILGKGANLGLENQVNDLDQRHDLFLLVPS